MTFLYFTLFHFNNYLLSFVYDFLLTSLFFPNCLIIFETLFHYIRQIRPLFCFMMQQFLMRITYPRPIRNKLFLFTPSRSRCSTWKLFFFSNFWDDVVSEFHTFVFFLRFIFVFFFCKRLSIDISFVKKKKKKKKKETR